jgi:hypothetical protein
VNRANSGVSVADMERTVGMPALALIRSGRMLLVRAANADRDRDVSLANGSPRNSTPLPSGSSGPARAAAVDRAPGGATAARAALKLLVRGKDPARA